MGLISLQSVYGSILEMRADRRTTESIRERMLCCYGCSFPPFYIIYQVLIYLGVSVHWQIRWWGSVGVMGIYEYQERLVIGTTFGRVTDLDSQGLGVLRKAEAHGVGI